MTHEDHAEHNQLKNRFNEAFAEFSSAQVKFNLAADRLIEFERQHGIG